MIQINFDEFMIKNVLMKCFDIMKTLQMIFCHITVAMLAYNNQSYDNTNDS